ncbi:MAG: glycosyltransferase, partial [Fimbriimonadales bacterium]
VQVYTVHNLAWHDRGTRFQRLVTTLAFRYRIGRVVPVAIAERVRASIQQVFGYPNPPLIPNGIALEEFHLPHEVRFRWRQAHDIEADAVVVTHIGRFSRQKNHELLVRAFNHLKCSQPFYLLLVGDGELRPSIEQLVNALHLSDRVRFLGIRADVPEILNASDIFVLSSRWEGNPMSVMEAMAAGLPVVATDVGGIPELVANGATGLLVPSEDVWSLSQALQTLLDEPERRTAMAVRARQTALERFDARAMTRAYERLYETLHAER